MRVGRGRWSLGDRTIRQADHGSVNRSSMARAKANGSGALGVDRPLHSRVSARCFGRGLGLTFRVLGRSSSLNRSMRPHCKRSSMRLDGLSEKARHGRLGAARGELRPIRDRVAGGTVHWLDLRIAESPVSTGRRRDGSRRRLRVARRFQLVHRAGSLRRRAVRGRVGLRIGRGLREVCSGCFLGSGQRSTGR